MLSSGILRQFSPLKWRPLAPYRVRSLSMDFFNRTREIKLLSNSLGLQPGLHVLTGPVNSGKSLIMKKLTESFKAAHVPVLHINLREISCNSVDSFVYTLRDATNSWLDQFVKACEHFKLNAEIYDFKIKLEVQESPYASPLTRLSKLLIDLQRKLPPYTFWRGTKAPILIIDEGNELRALLKDQLGEDALHNVFKWLVLNTKELRRFHAMFASSDSFFHLWVAKYIGSTRYESYVIGDLTKDEAKLYWEEKGKQMEVELIRHNEVVPPRTDFETIYAMCGGSMFLIEKALEFCIKMSYIDQPVNWNDFPFFLQEMNKLTKAYFPSTKLNSYDLVKSEPLWDENSMLMVMKELVGSPSGVVSYFDLCEKLGKPIIDSLIEHSILHLRPTAHCSFDIEWGSDIAITAESPCGLNAMKSMVNKILKAK